MNLLVTVFRPISLASSFSKLLENIILVKYSPSFFQAVFFRLVLNQAPLHFSVLALLKTLFHVTFFNGSTVMCWGALWMPRKRSTWLITVNYFLQKGLPSPIVRFLVNWYSLQRLKVRWGSSISDIFHVSNGVRQGGVLSPALFALYMDGLLEELSESGAGCCWDHMFAGALCYADDLVLLAPCASALRHMLSICSRYAIDHGLSFNVCKTQLICFCHSKSCCFLPVITFNDTVLQF